MKMSCRNCGSDIVEFNEAKKAVQSEYNYSDKELDSGQVTIRVWCPTCAVADGRINNEKEINGKFYWEAR